MYTRKENIPEENLDWGTKSNKSVQVEVDKEVKEEKHIIHPSVEHNKIVLQKKVKFSQLSIKSTILNMLDEHGEVTFLLGLLFLPYMIGFFVLLFILIYGGVPVDRFYSSKEGIFHFELWSMGAYIIITVGVIWLVIMLLINRR